MNLRVTAIFIALLMICAGCKEEKAAANPNTTDEQDQFTEQFKVTLNVTVKKDDSFQVYYKTGENAFTEEQSVWVQVKGSPVPQTVVFNIPEGAKPELVRLDFGMSEDQEDMYIAGIQMDYLGKNFSVKGPEIANYFRPLEGTEVDFKTGLIKATKKDGKRIEPVLYPHEIPLGEAIQSIIF